MNPTLDSPSKQTLWSFILPRMTREHRQYVLRYVEMPKQQKDGETGIYQLMLFIDLLNFIYICIDAEL